MAGWVSERNKTVARTRASVPVTSRISRLPHTLNADAEDNAAVADPSRSRSHSASEPPREYARGTEGPGSEPGDGSPPVLVVELNQNHRAVDAVVVVDAGVRGPANPGEVSLVASLRPSSPSCGRHPCC